jgi:outer membrane biosynthesis protein TonB
MAKVMKKAAKKKKDAPTPRAGKKRATAKVRKPRRKNEIASVPHEDAIGQDLGDKSLLKSSALTAGPTYLTGSGQLLTAGKISMPRSATRRSSLLGVLPKLFRSSAKNSSNA